MQPNASPGKATRTDGEQATWTSTPVSPR
ncbi:uncharacterized protein METZ01_LOCUS153967, partial [marine metagenome]